MLTVDQDFDQYNFTIYITLTNS